MQSRNQLAQQPYRLVYDAECQLCVSVKSKLERARTGLAGDRLQFVVYQSEETVKIALRQRSWSDLPGKSCKVSKRSSPSFQASVGGNCCCGYYSGHLQGDWPERGYRIIARHRYRWFGKAKAVRQHPPL